MPIKFQPLHLRISIDPLNVDIDILKWDKILLYEIYCHFLIENIYDNKAFWIQNDTLCTKLSCFINFSIFPVEFELFQFEIFPEGRGTSLKKIQINNLLNNVSGIKYVIFLQFFEVYQLYLPTLYKFEIVSSLKSYIQAGKSPV